MLSVNTTPATGKEGEVGHVQMGRTVEEICWLVCVFHWVVNSLGVKYGHPERKKAATESR